MALLSASDLSGELTPAQALSRAEANIAAAICPGLPDLSERTWVCEYRMRNDGRAYGLPLYGKRRLGPEVLHYWPITALVSVTQDGTDITGDCTFDTFSIRRDALSLEFAPLSLVVAIFKTGWPDGNSLPVSIQQAILLTGRNLLARPEGVVSEKLADWAQTYETQTGALQEEAQALLAPWTYLGA
ncbi:hypothetical protein GCM10022631_29620 [Deinococcus rubellus]|uniref:Uncharacterized protein n=1 Tax=Deinococcus rubellus TaxID=1889240 RepID=A0ABY5YIM1_9DEIO|nr:hypothetical protein [Deinococcus rubellus]UWX64192.1 hypothetical protein N0D28_00485 [Deinococcus rubellus]